MPKRRDFINKGSPKNNELARRIKIEAWKNFMEFRGQYPIIASGSQNNHHDNMLELKAALQLYLNRFINSLDFTFRPITRKDFKCHRSGYNFFNEDIKCWEINVYLDNKIFNDCKFKLAEEFRIKVDIFMDDNIFYHSQWELISRGNKS